MLSGYLFPSRWMLAICPVAGMLGNVAWRLLDQSDSSAVELSLPLIALLGLAVGATGIPTTLLGLYVAGRSDRTMPGRA
jgi:hypothetical protein